MYFSDTELGEKERNQEEISVPVWNGIVSIFERFKSENFFSSDFPENCPDGLGVVSFNSELFNDRVKSEIPNIDIPISRKNEKNVTFQDWEEKITENSIDKYSALDFLEFCYIHIKQPVQGSYHEYFNHYHLTFQDSIEPQKKFQGEINKIFERNGIVFFINDNGKIIRHVPITLQKQTNQIFNTTDSKLNELIRLAYSKFILPKLEDRINGLEKIWDAFERVKTFYSSQKNVSASHLIELVSNGNSSIKDELEKEAKALTEIGNKFQIRHFETDKIEITDNKHVDYLFYRVVSLIHLFMTELE
ncbi:MAG TPA: hypothetical protein VLZ83_05685 [Edaphocola sp.]|nr:hypothetical protein [Edaphocola sp.]